MDWLQRAAAQGAAGRRRLHRVRLLHRRRGDHRADGGDGQGPGRCRRRRDHAGRHRRLRPPGADQGGGARHARCDRRHAATGCTCTTPAASASPTRWPGWRRASAPSIPAWPGWAAAPTRRAPPATSSPRTWCSCWKAWASAPASTWRSCSRRAVLLHEGLPAEPLHGQLPKAGIPPTFRKAA